MTVLRHPGLVPGSTGVSSVERNYRADGQALAWMPAQGWHDGETAFRMHYRRHLGLVPGSTCVSSLEPDYCAGGQALAGMPAQGGMTEEGYDPA